jgi:hypothetical protein
MDRISCRSSAPTRAAPPPRTRPAIRPHTPARVRRPNAHSSIPRGTSDHGNAGRQWIFGPLVDPSVAGKAKLILKNNASDDKDQLQIQWTTVSNNNGINDGVDICIYAAGSLVVETEVPSGGFCGGVPCWTEKGNGASQTLKYVDKARLVEGIEQIILKDLDVGAKDKVQVKGKGVHLDFVPPPWTPPVTAEVIMSTGCVSATFSIPKKNTSEQFNAKSD